MTQPGWTHKAPPTRDPHPARFAGVFLVVWTGLIIAGLFFLPAAWRLFQQAFPGTALRAGWITLAGAAISLLGYIKFVKRSPGPALAGGIVLWVLGLGAVLKLLCRYPVEPFHAAQYIVLALLAHRTFVPMLPGRAGLTAAVLYPLLAGTIDEILQLWIPGRVFDPRDMVLNWISAGFGLALAEGLRYSFSDGKPEDASNGPVSRP